MRIAFLSADMCDGGAQRVTALLANELADMGHDVHMLIFSESPRDYSVSPGVKKEVMCGSYKEYCRYNELKRVRYIRRYLKKVKPQAAIGFLQAGYALYVSSFGMRFLKIASVRNSTDVIDNYKGIRGKLYRRWFSKADAVVVQTEEQRKYALEHRWKNVTVIPNPVNEKAFASERAYNDNCTRIIMAGRLISQKNYSLALNAFAEVLKKYPDVTLDIFGAGKEKDDIEALADSLNVRNRVKLKGFAMNIYEEYAGSDLFLLTSNYEGMPNALMESMASGLPCISTDCPTGPSDLITDGFNGFLVPVSDKEALAEKMTEVIGMSAETRKKIGMNASNTIRDKYDCRKISERWTDLFEKIM